VIGCSHAKWRAKPTPGNAAHQGAARISGAHSYTADLTLPYGCVVFDYNKEVDAVAQQAAE